MKDLARSLNNPDPFSVTKDGNILMLREVNKPGRVPITPSDGDLMLRWKSGAPTTRDEEAAVSFYVGVLQQVNNNLEDSTMPTQPVPNPNPAPKTIRVSTVDTERYIRIRDGLSETIRDNTSPMLSDAEARDIAEAIMNDFTIELPN